MRPNRFTLAAAALLALFGGAARAQKTGPASAEMALGRQSDYRPARAGFLLQGPVRSVKEEDFTLHKVVYERKHDAHGNWVEERIRQTEWRDGGVFDSTFLRSRTITYF